ncbi:MAG: IS30 family transposase [Planctomycetota bacterium]
MAKWCQFAAASDKICFSTLTVFWFPLKDFGEQAYFLDFPSKSKRKTMTVDNGKEFAGFKETEKSIGVRCYFANPYSSYQRGTNENTNGLLRQFFPKGTDFNEISEV